MTTWRVPEHLKSEIQQLVPSRYRTVSEAVSALCRLGLVTLSVETSTQKRQELRAEEEFYVPLDHHGAKYELPLSGVPLVPLQVLAIRYQGISEASLAHTSVQLYQANQPLLLSHTPLTWAHNQDLVLPTPTPLDPNEESDLHVALIAHDGWLLPRGTLYVRLRRAS